MAKGKKGYLEFDWVISLILAIIPITNVILGIVTRAQKGSIVFAILNIFLAPIFYFVDLISMIVNKGLEWLI